MARQQSPVFSGGAVKPGVGRTLRSRLATTTILAVAPFLGYGRQAHADCVASPSPTFICSGASAGQVINADDANVSTVAPFSVNEAAGHGIQITGNGHLRFTDENASAIVASADGLYVRSAGDSAANDGAVTIQTNGNITGGTSGIFAGNEGGGSIDITADGQVTGAGDNGIRAVNGSMGKDLKITTGIQSVVQGRNSGITGLNFGDGDLEIKVYGQVSSERSSGIHAFNAGSGPGPMGFGDSLKITAGAQSVITGGVIGVYARNDGSGHLIVTADGQVTGNQLDGIRAHNLGDGTYLKIVSGAESIIEGVEKGIDARNEGTGNLEITVNGEVHGSGGDGIHAANNGQELIISTGIGSKVTSSNGDGIRAVNTGAGDLKITTGAGSVVAGRSGIVGLSFGDGDLEIKAYGQVDGADSSGIHAYNADTGGFGDDLKITAGAQSVITGGVSNGIYARNDGSGYLTVIADGTVTGRGEVNPLGSGIGAINHGGEATRIDVGASGLVQGNYAGIRAYSDEGQAISITNDGVVRNLSGQSDDRAITTTGGAATIDNNGVLIGTVFTGAFGDTLNNDGTWNINGGTNDFGGSYDVVNNSGAIIAGGEASIGTLTIIDNLEQFNNSGLVSLVDGGEGDRLNLAALPGTIVYVGKGGRLAVDAVLAPGGTADVLNIDGSTSGVTYVVVNPTNPESITPNFDGITIVEVSGATADGDFDAQGGVLNIGFFAWDVRRDGQTHELYTAGLGAGSYQFAAGITGAQDIWHQTTGVLLQRQADLRGLLGGPGVTPVADYADPVEPTPVARITPGFWFRGVGAYVEREDEEDGFTLDREQTIWGGMAGFDFGSQSAGQVWMFGLFGGYLASDLEFDETSTKWTYEGPTVGAYVTYLDHGFYADLTVKADFLDIDIDPEDLAPAADDGDTDAVNIGGRIDMGYKFGETFFIEPQATLAVVHTEIDDVHIFGGTVEFDDETSVRGRLGLRLGFDQPGSDGTVYSGDVIASVWEEFSGDSDVSIIDPVFGSFGTADDAGGTSGDVSLGFGVAAPEGWSAFIRGNYLFGDDYEAITGNVGVRYAW